MPDTRSVFLAKAEESLTGAQSEFAHGRYNNCANRCYYACLQAAIAALLWAGRVPRSHRERWGHDFVQAEFIGQLINRRKVYPPSLREVLERSYTLRQLADYQTEFVTEVQASRALRRARQFVETIAGDKTL
jgi:uncharacterized protein (UPF0332 family)